MCVCERVVMEFNVAVGIFHPFATMYVNVFVCVHAYAHVNVRMIIKFQLEITVNQFQYCMLKSF